MSRTLEKLKRMNPDIIEEVVYAPWEDESRYWIYLKDGWLSMWDTHAVNGRTVQEVVNEFRSVRKVTE
jgi:hypothetical protein